MRSVRWVRLQQLHRMIPLAQCQNLSALSHSGLLENRDCDGVDEDGSGWVRIVWDGSFLNMFDQFSSFLFIFDHF